MEETAKVSGNDKSQAARLASKEKEWETFLEGLYGFTDDFFQDGREQDASPTQEGGRMA